MLKKSMVVSNRFLSLGILGFLGLIGLSGASGASEILPWHQCDTEIEHDYYSICYDETQNIAAWTLHYLKREYISGSMRRTNDYRPDFTLQNPIGSSTYSGTGFDRGHLVPAADMKHNRTAMSESFYMSNMTPQRPGFNRGIWQSLEKAVRRAVMNEGEAYIITAPVLAQGLSRLSNGVVIPEEFYKVIYWPHQSKAIAFVIPNYGQSGLGYEDFQVTIDELENLTGIDFFESLPDWEEEAMEAELPPINF